MGSMSIGHWLIVLIVGVLLFGAKKIPELAKGLGQGIKTFKKEMEDDTPEKVEKKMEQEVKDAEISDTKKA